MLWTLPATVTRTAFGEAPPLLNCALAKSYVPTWTSLATAFAPGWPSTVLIASRVWAAATGSPFPSGCMRLRAPPAAAASASVWISPATVDRCPRSIAITASPIAARRVKPASTTMAPRLRRVGLMARRLSAHPARGLNPPAEREKGPSGRDLRHALSPALAPERARPDDRRQRRPGLPARRLRRGAPRRRGNRPRQRDDRHRHPPADAA